MCAAAKSSSTLYAGQVIMEDQTPAEEYLKLKSRKHQATGTLKKPQLNDIV